MAKRVGWSLVGLGLAFCSLVSALFVTVGFSVAMPAIAILFGGMSLIFARASYIAFQLANGRPESPLFGRWDRPKKPPKAPKPTPPRRIVGKVRLAGQPLRAPLSDRPCAFFHARVEDERGEIGQHSDGRDFFVEHEGGRDLVRINFAKVRVKLDARYFSSGPQVTSRQEALLRRWGRPPSGELRYREGTLTEGEWVAVEGQPRLEPDPDPASGAAYREMPMRRVFDGSDVYVTDDVRVAR